jgi:hypothetical protein
MNTKFSELVQYFKTLASQHTAIAHSDNDKHFYRFELEEVLTSLKNINYPAFILEGYRYGLIDKLSDNVLKQRSGAFMIISHLADVSDFDTMHDIWDNLESICDDIIIRIKSDKRNPLISAIKNFDLDSVEVTLIANEIDNNFGIRCTFTVSSPLSMEVNSDVWLIDA